jgi:OB-fold nucleic acid binding domain
MLDQAISVAGLTEYLQLLIEEDDRLRQVWVVGEVSSTSPHRSGLFFAIQDPGGKAMINCVAWTSQLAKFATPPQKSSSARSSSTPAKAATNSPSGNASRQVRDYKPCAIASSNNAWKPKDSSTPTRKCPCPPIPKPWRW